MRIRKQPIVSHGLITAQKVFDDNRGLRIDLLLASQPLAECCVETGIDYEIRSMEKTVRSRPRLGDLPPLI
ncbi:exonuclease III [Escherichia coli]|uniref:Exonuclease III n=1 Tax=Escherichia coli TaxID=562 RepID=A0A376LN11_ECOLX|nr:exonuclease III [Escherichia coli]